MKVIMIYFFDPVKKTINILQYNLIIFNNIQ